MAKKLLILGVNGFIGHSLSARVLRETDWEVYGMDLDQDRIAEHLGNKRFRFIEGDISINREWIEYHVKKCDIVLPLVAIATPKTYVTDPLRVFELDFEENLRIVRQAAKYKKRVIFPSTSEVYGMCSDPIFDEEKSNLVLGPIAKQRWIYACSKQLLDRVIWAYGKRDGLRFTLFRPFNWIGPNLDDINAPKEGSSRVVTQFLGHILRREPVNLVDGGRARRSFTYVDDGIDGLMRIIRNEGGRADGRIFNLGAPTNECSVRELAETMIDVLREVDGFGDLRADGLLRDVDAREYYGPDYQDTSHRVPDIRAAQEALGWEPKVGLREALERTTLHYVQAGAKGVRRQPPGGEAREESRPSERSNVSWLAAQP